MFGCTVGDGAAQPLVDPERVKSLALEYRQRVKDRPAVAAASALRRAGDEKYLRKDFRGAQSQYREAYPNVPAPYSFVMAADSQLRALLEWNQPNVLDAAQCLRSRPFGADLRRELSQVYSVGLTVASAIDDRAFMASDLYRRAKTAEECLWGLAKSTEASPSEECTDLSRLRACLGDPLLIK
jgi:hypothetical protein